jgi:PrcB C-terminal
MKTTAAIAYAAVAFASSALAGCAQARHVDVMTILAYGNCQTNEIGVRTIDYATLATFRGAHLIGMTESDESAQQPVHLIAIVPGEFPTPGYSVTLKDGAMLAGDQLTIAVKTDRPAPDAVLAQMITHPCLVVGIADPSVARVKVVDDSAAVLGEVVLAAPKKP